MVSRTRKHIHAGAHVLLSLPVMDDEGPVPGLDEPGTDGQDDLQPSSTPLLRGLGPVMVILSTLLSYV